MLIYMAKKTKYRGVSVVEYAVLLAFVCILAAFFEPANGVSGSIEGAIARVVRYFGIEDDLSPNVMKDNVSMVWGSINSGGVISTGNTHQMSFLDKTTGKMYILDPNSTYEFTIDTSQAGDLSLNGTTAFSLTAKLFENNSDGTYSDLLDSPRNTLVPQGGQSSLKLNGIYYDSADNALSLANNNGSIYATSSGNKVTYTINTGNNALSFAGNIAHQNDPHKYDVLTAEERNSIQSFVENGFSLKKIR